MNHEIEKSRETAIGMDQCDRQPRNVALSEAIDSLDRTYEKANELLLRIIGEHQPAPPVLTDKKSPSTSICLREVLNSGPDRIRDKGAMIEGILQEIEEALF